MKQNDFYGNQFKWFIGVVKDATGVGRVRVRCFGIHPFEPSNQGDGPAYQAVSNGDLPWASVIMPNNETAVSHSLKNEEWVFGFFADGDACQQPVVVGKIPRADGSPSSTVGGAPGASGGTTTGSGSDILTELPASKPKNENYYNIIPGSSNKQKTFNLFTTFFMEEMKIEKERAMMIAAGCCGGIQGESNFDPGALYKGPLGNKDPKTITEWSRAYGLCQWLGTRKKALYSMCAPGDLVCQLNFTLSELTKRNFGHASEGSEVSALRRLTSANSIDAATDAWVYGFERPYKEGEGTSNLKVRRGYSQKIYFECKDKFEPAKIQFVKDNVARES